MLRKIFFVFLIPIAFGAALPSCDEADAKRTGYSIQGSIVEKGQGASGIAITVNNEPGAETNQAGEFTTDDLKPGTYLIKPDQAGRFFLPAEKSVTVTDQGIADVDFVRAAADQTIYNATIWDMFRQSVYSIKQNAASTLQLDLEQNALWYNNSQGGLIFRRITGDFIITARANAVRKSNNTLPVECNICLGGLMVRNSNASSGENYIHLVTGFTPNGLGVEFKSTTNGTSVFNTSPDGNAQHDLRIQRSASTFTLYQKLAGESTWNLVTTYNRTDLPAELLVGVNIYTAQSGAVADLSLIFENIEIN